MATKNQLPKDWENNYGFQFWINPDRESFRADGKYGQYIIIIPKSDMVVTVQSLDNKDVFKNVWHEFIEKIK